MTQQLPLLVEIGTEELPPKSLNELSQAFSAGVALGLKKRGIAYDEQSLHALNSPRRLAVFIGSVATEQPDQDSERRGPALAAGLDAEGKPSKALIGFAASCGVAVAALEKLETDKGSWFVHRSIKKGAPTTSLLGEIVNEAIKALPIPKPMRWGDRDIQFVRPAHWFVLLFGDHVVNAEVLGLKADRMSRGHRFHHPQPLWIGMPTDYIHAMRAAKVLVDPVERRQRIVDQLDAAREEICAATGDDEFALREDQDLLDEVNHLVEWPVAIACKFDPQFLAVPKEALIETMQKNQKFFPLLDGTNQLTEHFIGIANIESKDPNEIRRGYERVIRPRFADAKFFFDEDLKTPLASHQEGLKRVTYQAKLGSVWDKTCRVAELSRTIANRVGVEAASATKAAGLSKCDLLSRMVGEFPELQGIMGRTYAAAQGESSKISAALDEFYAPRFSGDAIAHSKLGQVLAIAEKIDTLAGLFAIGQKPSGNKDPFSLRRTALGLARTLIEGGLDLDLIALLRDGVSAVAAAQVDPPPAATVANEIYDFVVERLRGYYADQEFRGDEFDAVLAVRPSSLLDFDQRLQAIGEFVHLPEAQNLAAANKRIANILRQAEEKALPIAVLFDVSKLEGGVEAALGFAVDRAAHDLEPLLRDRHYVDAMRRLAELQAPIDSFFDNVMVMVDDPAVRANRLALLTRMRTLFLAIADIGVLQ